MRSITEYWYCMYALNQTVSVSNDRRWTGLIDWARSHQTHYRSYRGRVITGQMTQPTVSKHWRKIGPKDQTSIPSGPPHHAHNNTTMQYKTKTHKIHTYKCTQIYTQWNRPFVTKPNPENCKNCSSKCAYDCAQLQYTIQHGTVLIISPLTSRQTS